MATGFFKEMIDDLGRAQEGLRSDKANLREKRETVFEALEEIYCLMSTTINMIIVRLKDILKSAEDGQLAKELANFQKQEEWALAEKNFRFCSTISTIKSHLDEMLKIQAQDSQKWMPYLKKISDVFKSEDSVSSYIAGRFPDYLSQAKSGGADIKNPAQTRKLLFDMRNSLQKERRMLVMLESKFISSI